MRNEMQRVLAPVVLSISFTTFLGQALAEPLALQGRQQSAIALIKEPVQQDGSPNVARVNVLPRQESKPAIIPPPNLVPGARNKTPSSVTTVGRIPLTFIENKGQVNERAKFYVRNSGQTLWVTNEGIVFDLLRPTHGEASSTQTTLFPRPFFGERERVRGETERLVFAQDLVDAKKNPTIESKSPQPDTYNFFTSPDPTKWRTGVKAYGEVVYKEVWEGIDLKLYGNGRAQPPIPSNTSPGYGCRETPAPY